MAGPQWGAPANTPVVASAGSGPSWGGPPAAPVVNKKPGGLLGIVNKIPGASTVEAGLGAAGNGIGVGADTLWHVTAGIGTGLYVLGKDFGQSGYTMVTHPERPLTPQNDPFTADVQAFGKQTIATGSHPLRDPVQSALLASMFLTGGLTLAGKVGYAADVLNASRVAETGGLVRTGSEAAQAAADAGQTVTPLTGAAKARLLAKTANPLYKPPTPLRIIGRPVTKLAEAKVGIGPKSLETVTEPVQLHASGNPLIRVAQKAHDTVIQNALDRNVGSASPGFLAKYANKRIAGSLGEGVRITSNLRSVPEKLLGEAGSRSIARIVTGRGAFDSGITQKEGQLAIFLRSAGVTGSEAADYWAANGVTGLSKLAASVDAKGLLRVGKDGKVAVPADVAPKLARADALAQQAQGLRADVITEHNLMNPAGMQNRLDLVAKVMTGGKYVAPTAAKLGKPSPGLVKMRAYTARLEGLHERAVARSAKGELSAVQARAAGAIRAPSDREFAVQAGLDAANKRLTAARKLLPIDSPEIDALVKQKTAWQKVEIARKDMEAAASRVEGAHVPSPEEIAARVGSLRAEIQAARGPRDPELMKQIRKLESEAAALRKERASLNTGSRQLPSGVVFTDKGARFEPHGYARAQNLGSALSVARDRLQQMEQAAANRVTPTGMVGGAPVRPGQGFVSLKTSEKAAAQSDVAAARPGAGVIPMPKKFSVGKTATGKGVPLGKVPYARTTASIARGLHDILRYVNTVDFRGRAAKLGSDVKQTGEDILIRDPAAQAAAAIPENIDILLGRKTSTLEPITEAEHTGLAAAMQARLQEAIPGLRDEFAANREAGIGTRAPEGYKWIPRQMLPQEITKAVTPRGGPAKFADALNSAVTAATVYLKVGHFPTRLLTNATTNVVQGSFTPTEIRKSVMLIHDLSETEVRELAAATGTHGYQALPAQGVSKAARVAARGAGWWSHNVDAPFRLNAILHEFRQIGITTPAQVRDALRAMKDPTRSGMDAAKASRLDWAVRRANRESIMYDGLNDVEKRYVTRLFWFYPWVKGATRYSLHVAAEHPVKAVIGYGIGKQGVAYQKQQLGDVPSYEFGLTPLSGGANPLTANFSTFTPFSTLGDVAGIVKSPQTAVEQLNPAYAGLAKGVSDALEKKGTGKVISDFFGQAAAPTPESQVFAALTKPTGSGVFPTGGKYLFGKSWQSSLLRASVGPGFPRRVTRSKLAQDFLREHQKKRTITVYGP